MQILIVIIEKDGDKYIGRCPNLIGVSVTVKTRDEAETAILKAVEKRIEELNDRHRSRMVISYKPVEETIGSLYKHTAEWRKGEKCLFSAQKDGLCWLHWKKLYGHAVGNKINLDGCPLCGETDQNILKDWKSPCSFKAEQSNWEEILERKKQIKQSQLTDKSRDNGLQTLQKYLRCQALKYDGNQCSNAIDKVDLCNLHWKVKYSHKFRAGIRKLCGQRKTIDELVIPSICTKNNS